MSPDCPHCESGHTASRRQLFHRLMEGRSPPNNFSWYHERLPDVMPPRSRFVVMLAVMLGTALPFISMWFLDVHLAAIWLGGVTLLLVLGLLWDLLLTWRRHRAWAQEFMCAACRTVFTDKGIIFEGFDSGHFPVSHQAL